MHQFEMFRSTEAISDHAKESLFNVMAIPSYRFYTIIELWLVKNMSHSYRYLKLAITLYSEDAI